MAQHRDKLIASGLFGAKHLEAFDELAEERLSNLPVEAVLIYIVEIVDAGALPILAKQFDIAGSKGYNLSLTEEDRRLIVSRGLELNRFKGTIFAIREILSIAGYPDIHVYEQIVNTYNGQISYNGENNYNALTAGWALFNIIVTAEDPDSIDEDLIRQLVSIYKNERSQLQNIDIGFLEDALDGEEIEFTAVRSGSEDDLDVYAYSTTQIIGEEQLNLTYKGVEYPVSTVNFKVT